MPLRINCPSPVRVSIPNPGDDSLTLPERSSDAPPVVLTAKLPASTTGAEIVCVPLTTAMLPLSASVSVLLPLAAIV